MYENVNVSAVVNTLSDEPDFAIITIAGGMTVRPTVQSVDEIAVFPASVEVLSVEATPMSYVVKVFVKDPAALAQDTILIKPGVIQSYWGQKANMEKDVSITVLNAVASTATASLWPQSATVYTAAQEFTYDISSLPCPVDRQSFAGVNVEVLDVQSGVLRARLVDDALPGTLTFIGYKPDSCTEYNYPLQPSATVVKETEPHYTLHFKTATAGCTDISIVFDAPVNVVGEELLSITPVSGLAPSVTSEAVNPVVPEFFLGIDATVCISTTSDTLLVSVNRDAVKTPSGAMLPEQEPTSIYVSQMSLVMNLLSTGLPTPSLNLTYVMRSPEFTMLFNTPSGINIGLCDYSKAFTSDYNVEIRTSMEGANLAVSVKSNSIDHHVIAFHADRVVCDGSFTVEFIPQQFKYAYDPPFQPGDIIVTRVNTYYSAEFDFIPLRKVFSWNKVFFTDAGWVNEVYGFIDHGSDGYISWTPKTDVEAGSVQQWSYIAMTQKLDPLIPFVVDTEYSFNYEQHGFLLDFQDNLFVYVTDNNDQESRYDSPNLTFLFGIYWSSSEWAPQTYNHMDITAEYSALPVQLTGYSIALGLQASPVPRGVNYMSINQDHFFSFTNTYFHMIEMIVDKQNWLTSQKDRFTLSPQIAYVERPMDFTMTKATGRLCFTFNTPYTVVGNETKIALFFNDEPIARSLVFDAGAYCVEYAEPASDGTLRLAMEEGAFSTTTTSTKTPYTFYSVPFTTEEQVSNEPVLTVSYDKSKQLQRVTISSSIPCASWNVVFPSDVATRVLSQTPSETVLSMVSKENGSFLLVDGFCKTANGRQSASFHSETSTAVPVPASQTLLRKAVFTEVLSKHAVNTVVVEAPGEGWTPKVAVFEEAALQPTATHYDAATGKLSLTFAFPAENGVKSAVLPYGLFEKEQAGSQSATVSFVLHQDPMSVMESLTLPWATPIRAEGIYAAEFSSDFVVQSGALPTELLRFENQCRSLGYMMGPSVATSVSVAVLDGFCTYGAHAEKVMDPYTNLNAGFENTIEFDFLPPRGVAMLVESASSAKPAEQRLFWNQSPVLALFFSEPLESFDESVALVTVDNCAMRYLGHVVVEDASEVRYALSECQEGPVHVEVVRDIVLWDDHNNTCVSQDCIQNLPLTFEMDFAAPTITLSSETTVLFGTEMDVSFQISEPNTLFTCSSIGIAVESSSVSVEQVGDSVCHYSFSPEPVNGTYILFFVPEGRFTDRALNRNRPSNTLSPLVLNRGAEITVIAPEFTNQIQTSFTVLINYTWLCPNYEYVFPSTFEYDREIARIEKQGDSVIMDNTIVQTFTITFFNFEAGRNDRHKNIPIFIPAGVCIHPLGLRNNAVTFTMSFDNQPTVPSFEVIPKSAENEDVVVEVAFEEVKEFGPKEAAEYVRVEFQKEASVFDPSSCQTSRRVEGSRFIYRVACPLAETGNLSVTILEGAVTELTGVPSSAFSRVMYVNSQPPTLTLSLPDGDTFGPSVMALPMHVEVSELLSDFSQECFVFEKPEGLSLAVEMSTRGAISNQDVTVRITRMDPLLLSGTFGLYVKEHCVRDRYNNYNLQSNVVTFRYDFVAPEVVLNCPSEDVVLNTLVLPGTLSEPCQQLTPANVAVPSACSVRSITQEELSFTLEVSCSESGRFQFSLVNVRDLVGNMAPLVNSCEGSFTIVGPTVSLAVDNLIQDTYVNTATFAVNVTAGPHCASMTLTESNVVVENVKDLRLTQKDICQWTISGANVEEGVVMIRVLYGAAVDIYGGLSNSKMVSFLSYQSRPSVTQVSPRLLRASATNAVMICYDWEVTSGEGRIVTEEGCSDAAVERIENNCVHLNVAVTTGERCHMYLEEDFVHTRWELGSVARYVLIEIDDHAPATPATLRLGEKTVEPVADAADPSKKHFYMNNDFALVMPVEEGFSVDLEKLTLPAGRSAHYENNEVRIAFAFEGSADQEEAIVLGRGFIVDSFGRKSEPMTYVIHLSKAPVVATISMNVYWRESPVTACVSFSQEVALAAENVESGAEFTLTSTESCKYLLSFLPETDPSFPAANYAYFFALKNVESIYGNPAAGSLQATYYYYHSQPVAVVPTKPIVMSTLGRGRKGEIVVEFDRAMEALPTTLDELLVIAGESTPLSTYVSLVSVSGEGSRFTIVLEPKAIEESYMTLTVQFAADALVDVTGNNALPATVTLVIDNRPPRVVSVLHNGGSLFSALPLTLTVLFSTPVVLAENYVSMLSATSGSASLSFIATEVPEGEVTEVTVVSINTVPLHVGMEWSVTVAAGVATDLNGVEVSEFATTMTVSNTVLTLLSTQYGRDNAPSVALTFDKVVKALHLNKLTLMNAQVKEESIQLDGTTLRFALECAEQGAWSIEYAVGAVEGSDESFNQETFRSEGVFDNVAPVVNCVVPEMAGMGMITFSCTASEAIQTEEKLFSVTLENIVLQHTETFSADAKSVEVSFVAVQSYVPGYKKNVYVSLLSCSDAAGNECAPVRYAISIDFTPVAVEMTASREHLRGDETVVVVAAFSKPVTAEEAELRVDFNEELVSYRQESFSVLVPHRQFAWEMRLLSTELTEDVVPVSFILDEGVVTDMVGNGNTESSVTVFLNEVAPTLAVAYEQKDGQILMSVDVINGPMAAMDATMFQLSENVRFEELTSLVTEGSLTTMNMTFAVQCEVSCPFSIRFLSDKIFDLAGNKLEHDLVVEDVFAVSPRVTMEVERYSSAPIVQLRLRFSEPSDFVCASLEMVSSTESVAVLPKSCLNTVECICDINCVSLVDVTTLMATVPEGTVTNAYHLSNDAKTETQFFFSARSVTPLLQTAWTETDSVIGIPFSVSAVSPDVELSQEMVHCTNCEIGDWTELPVVNAVHAYTFTVSFYDDLGNYVRVFIESGAFVDPFGHPNLPSEVVLYRNAEAAVLQRLTYSPQRKNLIELLFSKPVQSCGGVITLSNTNGIVSDIQILSSQSSVHYDGSKVSIDVFLYGDLDYQLSWESNAFCDMTDFPASTECANCRLHTPKGIPLPPVALNVTDITAHSARAQYLLQFNGGAEVTAVSALLVATKSATSRLARSTALTGELEMTDLEAGTEYSLIIIASNMYGESWSEESILFTTLVSTPAPASDLRICNLVDPVKVDGVYVYTQAEACWTPSQTENVRYRLRLSVKEGETFQEPTVVFEGETTTAAVTLRNDVLAYRLTLETYTVNEETAEEYPVEQSREFVTRVNLEDVEAFPQGAGIQVVTERLTKNSVRVSFTRPLENYFRIEKYLIQYGNVFEEYVDATAVARESYMFRMDKCVGNQVLLTVRAGVADNFWGVPSNRVTVYCKTPRLQLVTEAGYDFVAFRVTSEVETTATCSLKAKMSATSLGSVTVEVSPVNVAPMQLFKSLTPDTDYTIDCVGYDLELNPMAGHASFFTTSTFVLPSFSVEKQVQANSYYVDIAVESVSVPGTVYCAARREDQPFQLSRMQYLKENHAAYAFPGLTGVKVTVDGLEAGVLYRARCIFDPDYAFAKTVTRRRLSDEEILFTTPALSVATWESMKPFGSVAVPANTQLELTASMPVRLARGKLTLFETATGETVERSTLDMDVKGKVVTVSLPILKPGAEYVLSMPAGLVVDAVSNMPLPGVSLSQKLAFTVFDDASLSVAPTLRDTEPKDGAEAVVTSSNMYFWFDRTVRLSSSAAAYLTVNGETRKLQLSKAAELVETNLLMIRGGRYFPERAEVTLRIVDGSICSRYGACVSTPLSLHFTVGEKAFTPSLQSIHPSTGKHVPAGEDIVLTFNKEVVLDDEYRVVFVDETGKTTSLVYGQEKTRTTPRLRVDANVIRVRGDSLASGHTYTVTFDAVFDAAGRRAVDMPSSYSVTYSRYSCSGSYIYETMGDECQCFTTDTKCECRCGKETPSDTVIGMLIWLVCCNKETIVGCLSCRDYRSDCRSVCRKDCVGGFSSGFFVDFSVRDFVWDSVFWDSVFWDSVSLTDFSWDFSWDFSDSHEAANARDCATARRNSAIPAGDSATDADCASGNCATAASRGTRADSASDAARFRNVVVATSPAGLRFLGGIRWATVGIPAGRVPTAPRTLDFPRETVFWETIALPAGDCDDVGGKSSGRFPAGSFVSPSRGTLLVGIPAVPPVGRWRELCAGFPSFPPQRNFPRFLRVRFWVCF